MLRRKVGEALRRKGCDDSFLRWSMLQRNPSGMLRRKLHWTLHFSAFHIAGTLTDKALRNGSIKKTPEKRGNVRDNNKRTRTENVFAITANPVRREYMGTIPNRVALRNVNPVNARNPVARTCYECGSTDHIKLACPRLNQA
ncbi:hypothetical protein Tco_1470990 [Tanacetum coccineum]